jgi:hypothetical protein
MISIPLHMNPFSSVWSAFSNQFKGENALNMNSVPQTGLNLFAMAISQIPGLESLGQFGMDPASIPGMQAISNAHSINEAMAENGLNPNGSNIGGFDPGALGLANLGSGLDPGADQGDVDMGGYAPGPDSGGGGYGMPGGEGVGGLW